MEKLITLLCLFMISLNGFAETVTLELNGIMSSKTSMTAYDEGSILIINPVFQAANGMTESLNFGFDIDTEVGLCASIGKRYVLNSATSENHKWGKVSAMALSAEGKILRPYDTFETIKTITCR